MPDARASEDEGLGAAAERGDVGDEKKEPKFIT